MIIKNPKKKIIKKKRNFQSFFYYYYLYLCFHMKKQNKNVHVNLHHVKIIIVAKKQEMHIQDVLMIVIINIKFV